MASLTGIAQLSASLVKIVRNQEDLQKVYKLYLIMIYHNKIGVCLWIKGASC